MIFAGLTGLQRINWVLLLGCAVCLSIFTVDSFRSRYKRMEMIEPVKLGQERRQVAGDLVQLSDLTKRDLFKPLIAPVHSPPKVAVPPKLVPPPPPRIPLSQRASRLRLVGIIQGNPSEGNPSQAVIEDQEHQKTLYVTSGQSINEVRIEKILNDRVLLIFDGENMELSL